MESVALWIEIVLSEHFRYVHFSVPACSTSYCIWKSLSTFIRKAVDFRCIIIHVISIGHYHFSNNCHVINKLSCCHAIFSTSTTYMYLKLCSLFLRHSQLCWVPWHTSYKLRAAKYGSLQTNYNSRTLRACDPSTHLKTTVNFSVDNYCWVGKLSCTHMISFCNLTGSAKLRHWKSTAFPASVSRLFPPLIRFSLRIKLSLPLVFSRRESWNKAIGACIYHLHNYGMC